jgi:hypothetical protein
MGALRPHLFPYWKTIMKRILLCCLATVALSACSSTRHRKPRLLFRRPWTASGPAGSGQRSTGQGCALEKKIDANIAANPDFHSVCRRQPRLDEVGKGQIQRQLASFQASKKLIVRGYCHRGSSNARAVAHARAVAVKQYLVASGVPAKHLTLRINTDKDAQGVQIASK